MRAVVLTFGLALSVCVATDSLLFSSVNFTKEKFNALVAKHAGEPILDTDPMHVIYGKLTQTAIYGARELRQSLHIENAEDMLRANPVDLKIQAESDPTPYFGFIPSHVGNLRPGAPALSFQGVCFKTVTAQATANTDGSVEVSLHFANPSSLFCSDLFFFGTIADYEVRFFEFSGTHKFTWKPSSTSNADSYDLNTVGIRAFLFANSVQETLNQIEKTAVLFEPEITRSVSGFAAKANLDFLSSYANIKMLPRTVKDVIINETDIHSGDFIGVIRLDGLDPMLGWAMGSTTGHTTVALWGPDGELYICESTASDSYWDVNGIQKTKYRDWIAKAKAASYHVVHVPLSEKYRSAFNETAAWEFFNSVEGFDYGYNNMFWGWVDTVSDNYPCVPNTNRCLSWDIIEVFFPTVSRYITKFQSFYDQAFNHRLNTSGQSFSELMQLADENGIARNTIPTLVEQDSFVYNLTRNGQPSSGPSMVCCVFVCHTWKAAGLFAEINNDINCAEMTNWDDYSLNIFDTTSPRPQACIDADPNNVLCQLLGDYTLNLNNVNSKNMYPRMAERCPGMAPDYIRPDNC